MIWIILFDVKVSKFSYLLRQKMVALTEQMVNEVLFNALSASFVLIHIVYDVTAQRSSASK